MSKAVKSESAKTTLVRLAVVVGGVVALIGVIFVVNLIARGSGEHERRIAEALIASIEQDAISADFDLSQQAQVRSMSASGSFELQDHDMYTGALTITMGGDDATATDFPLEISGSAKDSGLYVNISNTSKIVDTFGTQVGEMKPMLDSIAKKIDSKWLRIPQQDSEITDCTGQLFSALAADKEAQQQAIDAYIANRFVVVSEVEEVDEGAVYTVTTDRGAIRGFFTSLKSKDFFKQQDACSASYDPMGIEAPQQQDPQQPSAPQAPSPNLRISINKQGLISEISSQQRASDGVVSAKIDMSYHADDDIILPADNIVEFDSISGEVQQVAGAIAQQQATTGQQPNMPQVTQ